MLNLAHSLFKSYNFTDKRLGKLYKQTRADFITVLLDTGIHNSLECGGKKPQHICFVVIHKTV